MFVAIYSDSFKIEIVLLGRTSQIILNDLVLIRNRRCSHFFKVFFLLILLLILHHFVYLLDIC